MRQLLRRLLPQRLLDFRESVLAALEMERIDVTPTHWRPGPLLFRGGRADHSYYAKTTIRSASARVSAASVWRVITSIGGDTGYFTARFPWTLRGALDWIVGGPGLRRGRPHPATVRVAGYWHPAGLWGLLYWFALAPVHLLLFRAMARGIVRRAVELNRSLAAPDRLSS